VSDQQPPELLVLVIGLRSSKKSPVHPRWWITGGKGLKVDTSLNGLGGSRDSEISTFSLEEVSERAQELRDYFELRKREHDGERLEFELVTLQ
jgi:hypothetical protein